MSKQVTAVKDQYTENLYKIFKHIESYDDIGSASTSWGINLVNECCDGRNQYEFKKYLHFGGEAVIILVGDKDRNEDIVLKIALPTIIDKRPRAASLDKPLLPPRVFRLFKIKHGIEKNESENTARFTRGCILQKMLHNMIRKGGLFSIGYIPEVFYISLSPKLFVAMEYVRGQKYLDYCRSSDLESRLSLFLATVRFVEVALHERGIIHSDITHDNILVNGEIPVFLDFGIAKNMSSETKITMPGRQSIGKRLYASPDQMGDPESRDFQDDIFLLGTLFWVTYHADEPMIPANYSDDDISSFYPVDKMDLSAKYIYLRATDKDKKLRYKDIVELRSDVESLVAGKKSGCNFSSCPWIPAIKNAIGVLNKE